MTTTRFDEEVAAWVGDPGDLPSPCLLIDRRRVEANLRKMLEVAGGPGRLRPHVKTHKMAGIVRTALAMGITRHKCATLAEAEMLAETGAPDILLAYPPVGPNPARFARLLRRHQGHATFRVILDHPDQIDGLVDVLRDEDQPLSTFIDLNVGMGRTGVAPGWDAEDLARRILATSALSLDGIHAYDGHIRESDPELRRRHVHAAHEATFALADRIRDLGREPVRLVLGGTPTFPVHAALGRDDVECSPGTVVLHDAGYASLFPDLPFTIAAALLTRVVSRIAPGRYCLDLGHKAVAADPGPPDQRVVFPSLPGARPVAQSEEHLVVEFEPGTELAIGEPLLAIPVHICPTSALHQHALIVEDGRIIDTWPVTARNRILTI